MIMKLTLGTATNQLQGDDTFCITVENTANKSNPILIKSKDCTRKMKVVCQLGIPKAIETLLPPKFPCISSNQAVTRKIKREVESLMPYRQSEPMNVKGKQ